MNALQQTMDVTGGAGDAVHLLLASGETGLLAEEPEDVMAEIELRATSVSSVLEGIFHEPHGQPRWGLNE